MTLLSAPTPRAVIKRDGARMAFDADKIRRAIAHAGAATGEIGETEAFALAAHVVKVLAHRFFDRMPQIEEIQDVVEQALIAADHFATARAYIVYREQRSRLREDRKTVVDVVSSINEYLEKAD